ncbi:MAG TPA: hypothetical protein VFU03_01185 [Gemmatimonadales bacterium]|nr:hypothetical protein [Gemmatimonadales bacterium]
MASTQWAATERLQVRVVIVEGMSIEGDLHLQPSTALHETRETPLELLNRDERFFPLTVGSGSVVFLAKAQVAVLAYQGPVSQDPERESAALHIGLEVIMIGGEEYRGFAATELPPNRSRASDYLNAPETFFSLVVGETTVCLNRNCVRAARPLS